MYLTIIKEVKSMKKYFYLIASVMLSLTICSISLAGKINGRTFSSSILDGLVISAPPDWNIKDLETAKGDDSTDICEISSAMSKNGCQPECAFIVVSLTMPAEKYLKHFWVPHFDDRFEFTEFSDFNVDGKDAYEAMGIFSYEGFKIGVRIIALTGKSNIMMITITDYDPVFKNEIDKMVRSIDGI
jgi:hypothetical protein